jgi:hypothetical protein
LKEKSIAKEKASIKREEHRVEQLKQKLKIGVTLKAT